jgi:uncharacterized protein YndB with AHSA1/START domain
MTEERTHEQAIVQQESNPDQLVVTTFFSGKSPHDLFRHWTQPTLLKQWWPQEAALDPREGGEYHLSWPGMDWNLRGTYTDYEPDTHLAFTWRWSHEPDVPTRHVEVRFEPVGDIGTQLTVSHGAYTGSPQDQEERRGHLEGWTYFLTRLHTAID